MSEQRLNLLLRRLYLAQPIQQAKGRGRAPCVATHPRLDVSHIVKDLIHYLLPGLQLSTCISPVLRVNNVLPQDGLNVV